MIALFFNSKFFFEMYIDVKFELNPINRRCLKLEIYLVPYFYNWTENCVVSIFLKTSIEFRTEDKEYIRKFVYETTNMLICIYESNIWKKFNLEKKSMQSFGIIFFSPKNVDFVTFEVIMRPLTIVIKELVFERKIYITPKRFV